MFAFIKKVFIGLLNDIASASNHTECIPLSNQKCMTQPTLINLHPTQLARAECSLSIATFRASREHLGHMLKENIF